MKKIQLTLIVACLFIGQITMAFNRAESRSMIERNISSENSMTEKEAFVVRIYKSTPREELNKIQQEAKDAGITIEYKNIQYVNGELEAISMFVDCNDGYSGDFSTVDIPETGVGFYRDYSEDADKQFDIGAIFGEDREAKLDSKEFKTPFNKEFKVPRDGKNHHDKYDHEIEFLIGLNNYVTPAGNLPDNNNEVYSIDPITSWTYVINSVHTASIGKYLKANFHFGIQWYNLAFSDPNYQIVKGDQSVEFIDRSGEDPSRSKLNITYLNAGLVPVVYFGDSHDSFRIGAGIYGGYRIGSKSKFKYDNDGKDVLKDNFHLNSLHYGVKAKVGWKGIDLFATYDLNSLFIENRGPELNVFSFGIVL